VKIKISAPKRAIRRVINIKTVTFWRYQNIAIVFALIASLLTFAPQPSAEAAPPTCAQGGVCQVGDIGPGGGIVFYVASGTFTQTGATGSMCANSCKYLEAAPSGWNTGSDPNRSYNSNSGLIGVNAQGTAIGSGYRNSLAVIAAGFTDTATSAAALARSYRGGTKQDWYLASKDELNQMCKWVRGQAWGSDATICDSSGTINSGSASGFGTNPYWSSTENGSNTVTAWWQSFVSGEQSTTDYKATDTRLVRPIRAFAQEKFACGTSGTFTVINNVVTGNDSCTGSAVVPEGVTALGTSFYNSGLNSITLPSTLVTIGDSALRETQLVSVVIPASVTSIGFLSLASRFITSVTFATGSQLRTIGGYAFQSTKFTSISIPASVASIGTGAFELNPNLATINFLGSIPSGQPWSAPAGATVSKVVCDGSSRTCQVGENGPGGGTIYYYSSGGFNCGPTQSDTCNYLEVAPSTWSGASDPLKFWANASDFNYEITGVSKGADPPPLASDGVGLGYKDSLAIINNGRSIDSTTAAGAARAYSGGSKSDWYLPSPAELNLLCQWARGVAPSITTSCTGGSLDSTTYGAGSAGFTREYYWTSTQATGFPSYAHTRRFNTGSSYSALKNANFVGVRPIRAFAPGLAPAFSISSSSETVTAGSAITGYTITSTGGAIASYSISPAISSTPGLSFSTSTGLISGTPTTAASSRTYTITATNATSPSATRTFALTVNAPPTPAASISRTAYEPGTAANIGASLTNFDQTKSYQVTIKFVNSATNIDVVNGTLAATQGSTSLIAGYSSYSGSKLGFKGTYAAISSALSSVTWNPAVASGGVSIRIGISTAPGANEFYDANSNHYYRFVATGLSSIDARTAAEATTLFGMRGYLVEINTQAENDFVGTETTAPNIWIGASDRVNEGSFIWDGATSNPKPTGHGVNASRGATFSSWSNNEPNDHGWDFASSNPEREDCVITNWFGVPGKWNDYPCRQVLSYLIEYGGRPGETSTATSATLTTTVTAVNPPIFTAIYDKNGAVGTLAKASDTYTQGRTAITLPGAGTMTKAGHTFAGWSESGSAPAISGTYAPTSSVTLKAVWTAVNYTITYNANGGDTTPTQASKTIGETFTLANPITRTTSSGPTYQFVGWNNGTSTIKAGSTITVGSSNLTYTAVWVVQFEVTYAANGGAFAAGETDKDSQCVAGGNLCTDNQSITLNAAPTRAGYTFAGWEDQGANLVAGSDSGSGAVQATVTTSRYIFTARWTAVNYTISYVSNGSTAPTETSKNIGQRFTIGAAVTKTNFDFAGWSDGTTVYWPESRYIVGSTNVTLTAQWTSRYTVTYSEGLGTGTPPTDTDTYRSGDAVEVLSGIAVERAQFSFNGWSDGTSTYQPGALYSVGSANVTLTAQWAPVYTVGYSTDLGPNAGTPPTDSTTYRTGATFTILSGSGLTNSGFTFAGWNDGTRTYQAGATYTVATSNVSFTAQWTAIPATTTPTPTPVVTGPPPSTLKTLTAPKILRDDKGYYCEMGTYVFIREGRTEETPKLTTSIFSLLQNGKVIESIKATLAKVSFTTNDPFIGSTMSCQVEVGQENLSATSNSNSSAGISVIAAARKAAIDAADTKYYKDRDDAYAKKDQEFARIAEIRAKAIAASKSSKETLAASANYQKAFAAASNLWKQELADAATNRTAGKDLAQQNYLKALEAAGISIAPAQSKPVVTPTPTPTPTPKPTATPTPSPTATTIPQPTTQMEKVGTVFMASGSYSLNAATKLTLKAIALKINASGAKSILVYGHTDNRGGVNNTVLSQNRAKAVANYLRPLVRVKKISIGWYASKKPVAGGTSASALSQNRRVEIYTK